MLLCLAHFLDKTWTLHMMMPCTNPALQDTMKYQAHTLHLTMDDNCGEWVECMGVASGCGYQEVGVASGSGWNLWVWLVGGMYGCGYQEVGVVGRRRVWLAGGIYGCGYQEVGVVSRRWVWLVGGMYGCGYQEVGVVGNYWCG